jgi:hypothetical protein
MNVRTSNLGRDEKRFHRMFWKEKDKRNEVKYDLNISKNNNKRQRKQKSDLLNVPFLFIRSILSFLFTRK